MGEWTVGVGHGSGFEASCKLSQIIHIVLAMLIMERRVSVHQQCLWIAVLALSPQGSNQGCYSTFEFIPTIHFRSFCSWGNEYWKFDGINPPSLNPHDTWHKGNLKPLAWSVPNVCGNPIIPTAAYSFCCPFSPSGPSFVSLSFQLPRGRIVCHAQSDLNNQTCHF